MTINFEKNLEKRRNLGNLRQLKLPQNFIDFSSNDYLGLARSSQLAKAAQEEWKSHNDWLNGFGSTGSRLLTGNSFYAETLENILADLHGYEAGVVFNCGYMANLGLISIIGKEEDTLFYDAKVHASTHDGIRLSRVKALPFKHNSLEHLEKRLKYSSGKGDRFICVESIYSTDGSIAPLHEICQLAKKYEAHVIVDEAHAVGVLGPKGLGLVAELELSSQILAQITTFGKAPGCFGAIIFGSHLLKEALINFSTSYIYTTALPFHMLAAIKCSYKLFSKMDAERQHIQKLISIFSHALSPESKTHIQTFPYDLKIAQKLAAHRFDVRPLLSPTVQRGKEIFRICLHAFNTEEELEALIEILK